MIESLPTPSSTATSLQPLGDGDAPVETFHYNPADYRWVPVRRRGRYDGWTEEKQRRFIETLADTGQVGLAAKSVGLSRESAYQLRRAAHGAAFARAWDAARHHAGSMLEDIAFERAIEGVEHNVFNEHGEVIAIKRVYNDRLLQFLLRHLKPERYSTDSLAAPLPPPVAVDACLRDLEPKLPAPPEELFSQEDLEAELEIAEIADGKLPHFLQEQCVEINPTPDPVQKARVAVLDYAKEVMVEAGCTGNEMTHKEFTEMCDEIELVRRAELSKKRFR